MVIALASAGAVQGGAGTARAEQDRSATGRQLLFCNHAHGVLNRETADAIEHSSCLRDFAAFQVRTTTGTGGQTWTGRCPTGRETYLELFGSTGPSTSPTRAPTPSPPPTPVTWAASATWPTPTATA